MPSSDPASEEAERPRAEGVLREHDEHFRLLALLAENAIDLIRLHQHDGRSVYASPSVEHLYGRMPTTLFEFAHPEDVETCQRWWQNILSGGKEHVEWRAHDAAGRWRWFETSAALVRSHDKPHVMTICREITDRKRVEEQLRRAQEDSRRSENELHLVIDTIPVMAWTVRPDGAVDFLNRRWVSYYGLSLEQYVVDPTGPIHPEDVARVIGRWRVQMAIGEAYDDEMRLRRSDGEYRWFLVRTAPLRDEQGNVVKWYGVSTDIEDRRRAEDSLRESERLLRQVLDALPVGVAVTNLSGDILLSNPASRRIWGEMIISGAERYANSKGWWKDTGKRIGPDEWASVRAYTRGESSINELIAIETFDGQEKSIQDSAAPVRDADGLILGAVVVNEDVTDRERAKGFLRESERRLNEAQRMAHIGHWEEDLDTSSYTASDETYRIFGLRPQEDLKTWAGWQEHLHPEDRPIRAAAIERALREGAHYEVVYRLVWPDGDIRIIHSQGDVIRDETGRPRRLFGIVRDITEHRQAERALREAELRLEHVVASSPAVLFTLRVEDGQIREIEWMSANIEAMLGYRVEETLGADWWLSNIHPDDRDAVLNQFFSGIFRSDYFSAEYRFRHKDGRYHWIRGENRLLRDATGQATEVVGSLSDVTERKRLEDQFQQAQKMEAVGHLAGGMAHDFNNLLTIISGYSEILLPTLPPTDPRREMISEIRHAGERAAGLTRQLLAFSRRTVLEPKVLDLNDVVRENEKMLRRLIGEDVHLTAVLEPALEPVKVDPGQIGQVIMNLAVNARDAMPTGGKLTIETGNVKLDEAAAAMDPEAKPGRYVLLAMTDTGTGMTPEVQAHIFEPFYTTKGPGKGTGLGLATVYGIVKQSGGFISVYSEPGRGTTYKIYFPVAEGRLSTGKSFPGLSPVARGTETILLVEDEDAVRSMVRVVLQQAGYTVLEADRGTEALRLAGEHPGPIHLLITDVVMPEMGGRELVERLASLRPEIKMLYLSGYTDDAVVRHGVLQADVAFLQKPFAMAALTIKVRQVLDEVAA